jgi:hypothetical protein
MSYADLLDKFDDAVVRCSSVSRKYAGIPSPTGRHFWASVIFTRICTSSFSLLMLLPKNRWSKHFLDHWDYASVATLTRSIFESYMAFYYLCVEDVSHDEWDCRLNLFNLHDCISRKKLFENIGEDQDFIKKFDVQTDELRTRLISNSFFSSLNEKQRKHYLIGKEAYVMLKDEIIRRIGMEDSVYRTMYRFLSVQVHTFPMSYYRMGHKERGRGIHSQTEEGYTSICIEWLTPVLIRAYEEMEDIFNKALAK